MMKELNDDAKSQISAEGGGGTLSLLQLDEEIDEDLIDGWEFI